MRINNHEHTDLQEYIGTYMADVTEKLAFKEVFLVQAVRNGYWIILDELNLAPSAILEALNRVLDDNQELYIPKIRQSTRRIPISCCLLHKIHQDFMVEGKHCRESSKTDSLSFTRPIFPN
jgi:MoxR-like ATPase